MKADHITNGQGIKIHIQHAVTVKINIPVIQRGDGSIIRHGEELADPASRHLLMHFDLPLSLARVFIQLAINGIKGIAEG